MSSSSSRSPTGLLPYPFASLLKKELAMLPRVSKGFKLQDSTQIMFGAYWRNTLPKTNDIRTFCIRVFSGIGLPMKLVCKARRCKSRVSLTPPPLLSNVEIFCVQISFLQKWLYKNISTKSEAPAQPSDDIVKFRIGDFEYLPFLKKHWVGGGEKKKIFFLSENEMHAGIRFISGLRPAFHGWNEIGQISLMALPQRVY